MTTLHSPAPWKEETDDNGDHWVRMDEAHSVFFGNLEDTCGTCHANARLVASAPELLETLQNLVIAGWRADDSDVELTENQRNIAMADLWEALRNAEKVIAKAKGK